MRILVTGGEGMLATALRNKSAGAGIQFCNRDQLDITDPEHVMQYCRQHQFDIIVNCAAYTRVEDAESNEATAFLINETGTANLAKAAAATNAYLIHISTDAVYNGQKAGAYGESDVCQPLSVYARSKYAGELALRAHTTNAAIIRTSWLYSADKPCFVSAIINRASATGKLSVVCNQLGSPTYTYDLAEAIYIMIEQYDPNAFKSVEVYHYSNEGCISWYDFAKAICDIAGINADIKPIPDTQYPSKVSRPFHTLMSKDKIKAHFGLSIPYWRDSLKHCLLNTI